MRKSKCFFINIVLLSFLFMGVTIHIQPTYCPTIRLENTSQKGRMKSRTVRKTFVQAMEQRLAGKILDGETSELVWEASKLIKSHGDRLKIIDAARRGDKSALQALIERGLYRASPAEIPDDSSSTLDTDFNSDTRVNSVYTNSQAQPDMTVGPDGIIYCTWIDNDGSANEYGVAFSKSTDGGVTWSPRVWVDNYGPNRYPSIAVYGTGASARIYIAYTYIYDAGNYDYDIYLTYSSNGGSSWSTPIAMNANEYYADMPVVDVDASGYAYVAYTYAYWSSGTCESGDVSYYIRYRYSADGGASWSGEINLRSAGSRPIGLPAIDMEGGGASAIMHFTYVYDYNSNPDNPDYDVRYCKFSGVGTGSPSAIYNDIWIAATTSDEYTVPGGIAVGNDLNPQITFTRDYTGAGGSDSGSVFYRRSWNGGGSFVPEITISNGSWEEIDIRIALDCLDQPMVVWRDARNGSSDLDIYFTWSTDSGRTFQPHKCALNEASPVNQYWPCIAIRNTGCTRQVHFAWWDTRYSANDIYYNGNEQNYLFFRLSFPTGVPPQTPQIRYYAWEQYTVTNMTSAGNYLVWYDHEYTGNTPLIHRYLGIWSNERWACDQLSTSWVFVPDSFWKVTCGIYGLAYSHQYLVRFQANKGNPAACTHFSPNLPLNFITFGVARDTFINTGVARDLWVDVGSAYHLGGTVNLDPCQRWYTVSVETTGTIVAPATYSPTYYHQWKPTAFFTQPSGYTWTTAWEHTGGDSAAGNLTGSWQNWVDCGTRLAFSPINSTGCQAITDTDTVVTSCVNNFQVVYASNRQVTVQNDFGAGTVIMDGITYASPHTETWAEGSNHIIRAVSPQTFSAAGIGDTVRYEFAQWADGPTAIERTITVPGFDIVYTAQFTPWWRIRLTYSGETGGYTPSLIGDGLYQTGTWANISATEAFDPNPNDGERYGFSHWESTPPGAVFANPNSPSTQVYVNRYYTITAVYSVQYSFDVFSTYGTPVPPVGRNWCDANTVVMAKAGSPDTVYHKYCIGYSGTGDLASGGSQDSIQFTITRPDTITWLWADQVHLVVNCGFDSPNPPTGTHWYNPGTTVNAQVDSIVPVIGGIRLVCTGYTGTPPIGSGSDNNVSFTITNSCTLTWLSNIQYSLTINNPAGHDAPQPPVGVHWYFDGSVVTAFITTNPTGGWVCIGFNGSGSVPTWSPQDSITFTINAPTTITWNWADLSSVCSLVVVSPSNMGNPQPYGTTYWLPGSGVNAQVTTPWYDSYPTGIRDSCTGFTGTGSAPSSGTASSVSFTINTHSTLNWYWQRQYRFDVNNPSGFDTPVPPAGQHWYNDGTIITASVTSPWQDTIVCEGYTGTGSISSGSGSWVQFTIDTYTTITWNWRVDLVSLSVESDRGSPDPPVGTHHYMRGTEVLCRVDSVLYSGPNERWRCVGWIGTGSVPSSGTQCTVTVTLNADTSRIIWLWQHEYKVTVNSGGYGNPVPPEGVHWFPEGWLTLTTGPNPYDTFYCVGYMGTGSIPTAYGDDSVTVWLNQGSSITWIWMGAGSVAGLQVISPHGDPHPYAGMHYYPRGFYVNAYMLRATDSLGEGTRFHCTGYIGTGSAPSGSDTSVGFTINVNSTLTWTWATQHRFVVNNPGGYDTPNPAEGSHWFDEGEVITAFVNPVDDTMRCVGYWGTGSVPSSGWGYSVTFVLSEPSTITWRWMGQGYVVELDVRSDYGHPSPPVGINYIPRDSTVVAQVEAFTESAPGDRVFCTGWTGLGSVPSSGSSNIVVFVITVDSRIVWNWRHQYQLVLTYSGETGGVEPLQTGEGWYDDGDTADIYTQPDIISGGSHYGFIQWLTSPTGVWVEERHFFSTRTVVNMPCTLIATYGVADPCTLSKSPPHSWGGFVVDGVSYSDTSRLIFWWGRGSQHLIEASDTDYAPSGLERYIFHDWSDGGARVHWVNVGGPVHIVANYELFFKIKFAKIPHHTVGFIKVDGVIYNDSVYSTWWKQGTSHTVEVSTPDINVETRYVFTNWSDGYGSPGRAISSVSSPINWQANYQTQHLITVTKEPPETLGHIAINSDTSRYVHSASKWVNSGTNSNVWVTLADIRETGDSAYVFRYWNENPADTVRPKNLGLLSAPARITAHYELVEAIISFSLNVNIWDLDTLNSAETRLMEPGEVITVTNTGNIPIDFGLLLILEPDSTSWHEGPSPGIDVFSLRARFDQNSTPPSYFSAFNDRVKTSLIWASPYIFGPMGYYVAPSAWNNLWLKFWTPANTTDNTRQTIILRVRARATMY